MASSIYLNRTPSFLGEIESISSAFLICVGDLRPTDGRMFIEFQFRYHLAYFSLLLKEKTKINRRRAMWNLEKVKCVELIWHSVTNVISLCIQI